MTDTPNPLSAIRQYVDLSDQPLVDSLTDLCSAGGLYLEELQGDPGVWLYRWAETDADGKQKVNRWGQPMTALFYIHKSRESWTYLVLGNLGYSGTLEEMEDVLLKFVIDEGYVLPSAT